MNTILGEQQLHDLLDEFRGIIEQIRILGWKELKPWPEFFSAFKLPQWNLKHLEQRVTTNFLHYRSNYMAICLGVILLQILFAPFLLLVLVLIVGFLVYTLLVLKKSIRLGDIVISVQAKTYLSLGIVLVFTALTGALEKVLWTCIYCLLLCLLHMVFRPRSVSSKANRMYEEMKISGFNWFGGNGGPAVPSVPSPRGAEDIENTGVTDFGGFSSVRKRPSRETAM